MLRHDDAQPRVEGAGRFRELLAVAVLPVLTGYAAVATLLATVAALATGSKFSVMGIVLAAGPGWLAAYQVPLVIADNELGLLPLALTVGVCALVARAAAGAAERLGYRTPREAGVVIGTVAGTHAVVGVTIAVLANGAVVTADPLHAFVVPGLLSGAAATVGVARRCGLLDALRPYVDDAAVAGMRAAALGMAGLLAAAALVLTAATVLSVPTMHTLFLTRAPGIGAGFGMLLLCLGYLPNALLAALAFVLGPGFTLGATSLGPMYVESGPVPAVPLLAGLPESDAVWWPALLVLPALVGAGVGWALRGSADAPVERVRGVAVAGAVIGFATVVLATLAGGGLGGGPYPGLLLPAGLLSVAAFAWIFIPGALVSWFTGPRPVSHTPDAVSHADDGVSHTDDAVSHTDDGEFDTHDGEFDGSDADDVPDEDETTEDAAEASDSEHAEDVEDAADAGEVDVDTDAGEADGAGDTDAGANAEADAAVDGENAVTTEEVADIDDAPKTADTDGAPEPADFDSADVDATDADSDSADTADADTDAADTGSADADDAAVSANDTEPDADATDAAASADDTDAAEPEGASQSDRPDER